MSPWLREWYSGLDERIAELEKISEINTVINKHRRRGTYDFASTGTFNLHGSNAGSFNGMSYYTGNYTHSIQLTDGVAINYSGNGIRVDQVAQWVGLGWNLSAGGKITRNVKGYPDDLWGWKNDQDNNYIYNFRGWLNDDPTLISNFDPSSDDEERCEDLEYFIDNKGIVDPNSSITNFVKVDTEPDLFIYDYHGVRGSFLFGNDKQVKHNQFTDLNVSYVKDGYKIIKITIEDRNGNQFIFGDDQGINVEKVKTNAGVYPDANKLPYEDKTFPHFQSGSFSNLDNYLSEYIQTWYLTKMILPDKSEVVFEYEDEWVNLETTYYESYRNHTQNTVGDYVSKMVRNFQFDVNNTVDLYSRTRRLKKIYSEDFEVEFISNNIREDLNTSGIDPTKQPKSLDKIRVFSVLDGSKTLEKQIDFCYSYFESGYDPAHNSYNKGYEIYHIGDDPYGEYIYKRLKLDSISIYNGNQLLPPYIFDYVKDIEEDYWLPARYSFCQDIFGYFKSSNESVSLIPTVYAYPNKEGINRFSVYPLDINLPNNDPEYVLAGTDRLPDASYLEIGMLSTIYYPNGSHTSIEYEQNEFELEGTTYLGPGIRVKSLNYGGEGVTPMTKEFSYNSGKLVSMPHFGHFDPINTETNCSNYFYSSNYSNWGSSEFNNYYIRGTHNEYDMSDGLMGYSSVEVEQPGIGGKTVYNFVNEATYGQYDQATIEYPNYQTTTAFATPSMMDIEEMDVYSVTEVPYEIGSSVGLDFTESSYPYQTNTNYSWHRGKLLSTMIYNENDQLVSSDVNDYDFIYLNAGTQPEIVYGLKNTFLRNNLPPVDGNCSNDANNYDYLFQPLTLSSKYEIQTGKDSYISSSTKSYLPQPGRQIDQSEDYTHNKYGLLSEIVHTDAENNDITTKYLYICDLWDLDISIPDTSLINQDAVEGFFNAISNNRYALPIQTITYKQVPGDTIKYLLGATILTYKSINLPNSKTLEVVDSIFVLKEPGETMLSFDNAEIILNNGNYSFDFDRAFFELKANISRHNTKGKPIELIKNKGLSSALIYAINNKATVFESVNALECEIAYQGFEDHELQNWTNSSGCSVDQTDSRSGEKALNLGDYTSTTKVINYSSKSNGYVAKVWVKGNGIAKLTLSTNSGTISNSSYSTASSDWELVSVSLEKDELSTLVDQQISILIKIEKIAGSNILIDDIMFTPDDSFYKGIVFDNHLRVTTEFDINSKYISYEYDDFDRLILSRDDEGNILSVNDYFIGDPCDFVYYPDNESQTKIIENIPIRFVANVKNATSAQISFSDDSTTEIIDSNGFATHSFTNEGVYTVELTMVIDGVSYSKTRSIEVHQN